MWFFLSLLSAVFAGSSDAFAKKALLTSRSETVAWVKPGWGSLFMIPVFWMATTPSHPRLFWTSVGIALPMEIGAALAYQKAIQLAPLSLSVPYLAFTPVFLLLGEWLFLGIPLTLLGSAGILCVVAGAFLLQLQTVSWSAFRAHQIVPREKGPLLMLGVAFTFSITTIFAKRALMASSPFYFSSVYFCLIALGLLPFQFRHGGGRALISHPGLFLALGGVEAASFLVQFFAMEMKDAAYVIAIKRLSLLVSVVMGWLFFKEQHLGARLVGASAMILGAILIAVA